MKIFNETGSKVRLFEMMEKVNKVKLNEEYNPNSVLEISFQELKNNRLNIEHSNTQVTENESYVELVCTDKQNNTITFTFKVSSIEGDQEGVFKIGNAELFEFSFDDAHGGESIQMDANELKQFNAQYANELIDIVSEYVDVETEAPEAEDSLYEDAINKIDSYPFGGKDRKGMVTGKQYADEKPTNPAVRVKAPELEKFVDETTITPSVYDVSSKYFKNLPEITKKMAIEQAKKIIDGELEKRGMQYFDIPENEYKDLIKRTAIGLYEAHLGAMNEDNEKDMYPDPIGKKFKPKSFYPKKKKKPQTTVKLSEEIEDDELNDVEGSVNPNLDTTPESEPFKNKETGEESQPNFDIDQIIKGLEVEKENTDNSITAIGKVVVNLSNDPEYYSQTSGENVEDNDKEMTDVLLGYEPHNVGDEVEDDEPEETPEHEAGETPEEEKKEDELTEISAVGTMGGGDNKQLAGKRLTDYQRKGYDNLSDDEKADYAGLWKDMVGMEYPVGMQDVGESKENEIKEKDPATWHQIQIAKRTLKMPDAMAGVMGGMTKQEATQLLMKHNLNALK
jgi:hypothetical protein